MNMRLPIAAALTLVAATANAQDVESPLSPLYACQEIPDGAARLACLDTATTQLRAEESNGDFIAVRRDVIEAADEASYGLSIPNFSLPNLPRVGLPSFGSSETTDMASAAETSDDGQRTVLRNERGEIERITGLAVASFSENRTGQVTFTLENGQVWRQIDQVHVPTASARNSTNNVVSIRSGALSSHMMQLNGSGRWFRVTRVR